MKNKSLEKKLKEIIKENIWGYVCKECNGAGALGQDKCQNCNGTGIVDWEVDLGIKKLLSAIKEELPEEEYFGMLEDLKEKLS